MERMNSDTGIIHHGVAGTGSEGTALFDAHNLLN